MTKKNSSPFFVFGDIWFFETLIFKKALLFEKYDPLISILYFRRLKDKCEKEIDRLTMKNNKKRIFKYLDNIESNGE